MLPVAGRFLFLAALLACAAGHAFAVEPWADRRMKVAEPAIWLDASSQSGARIARARGSLFDQARVDVWYDASGHARDLSQRQQSAQPRFVPAGNLAVMRFDGEDDCLELPGLRAAPDELTLYFVASVRTNPGMFRGFVSGNQRGQNDYTSGLNVDLSGFGSAIVDRLNIEGRGFGGQSNLLTSRLPFGQFHAYEVAITRDQVRVAVDGVAQGMRRRAPGPITLDDLVVGARIYSNSAEPPFLSGFLDGDIAELIFFDRSLSSDERTSVTKYLRDKHAPLAERLAAGLAGNAKPLVPVKDPPPVQMFVPGFTVRELPVELTNVNNVRYRHDGKLVALGYDGNIHLLSDTDGDGLEDRVEPFWQNAGQIQSPIGMAVTPAGYPLGDGVFVACKGKVSLLLDSKRTGRADQEIVVAEGWRQLNHSVDALGLTLANDGSVYFGLGTSDFTNAYLLADGTAGYDLKSERGTILRVAPDFKSREVVATGLRFAIGMAFNARGDLFITDQEGATWLPNGNPFDELLHIQPGRHYGFPPRHPNHLPQVIDEPSVFDYPPQHQSICGLAFNEPSPGGQAFGPALWQGDALATGYSRGKLYRTRLAHTENGYVAQTQLIACLKRLAADLCVSPQGALVVATHSGEPDWGSGPSGSGHLYKVEYRQREIPQPALVYAAGPREIRVAFDRPLELETLKDLASRSELEFGEFVAPGDRFESLRPGYAVVGAQLAAPRIPLKILGTQISPDRRTLSLVTEPAETRVSYALKMPRLGAGPETAPGELPQIAEIDLGYDLRGVAARWQSASGDESLETWLPHFDLAISRQFTAGSAEHERFFQAISRPGSLTLSALVDLKNMLRPEVQPGSRIDYEWPDETASLAFQANGKLSIKSAASAETLDASHVRLAAPPDPGEPIPVEVTLVTGNEPPALGVSWSTNEDDRQRALPLRRLYLPWSRAATDEITTPKRPEIPELAGGNWLAGRDLFFDEQALCGRCHTIAGRGGRIGPDLSNLVHRDYASVLKDIRQPSAAINPDHVAFALELTDGRAVTGLVRREGERVIIGDKDGNEIVVTADEIESQTAATNSLMPEGIDKVLGPDKLRDLLTFLLTEPLTPAAREIPGAPPLRTRAELKAAIGDVPSTKDKPRPLRIVLCTGPKDHGLGEHDYPLWRARWKQLLGLAENVVVAEAENWPSESQFAQADAIVFYSNNPGWTAARAVQLDAFLARGGGLVYLHYAVDGHDAASELAERIGLAWRGGSSKFRHGRLELDFSKSQHVIARGLQRVTFEDESYWNLVGETDRIDVIATGEEEGAAQPLLWTREPGAGRVFVSILGHYTWTFDDPLFRLVLLRGLAWSAGESVDRFNDLVPIGAEFARE